MVAIHNLSEEELSQLGIKFKGITLTAQRQEVFSFVKKYGKRGPDFRNIEDLASFIRNVKNNPVKFNDESSEESTPPNSIRKSSFSIELEVSKLNDEIKRIREFRAIIDKHLDYISSPEMYFDIQAERVDIDSVVSTFSQKIFELINS